MMLAAYIKPAPNIWKKLPHVSRIKGCLLFRTIYLQKEIYEDLLSTKPKHHSIGILIHEETHYTRIRTQGMVWFGLRYLFSRKHRFQEEFVAYTAQMKYLKRVGETLDREHIAQLLSSRIYLWATSYNRAKRALDQAWETA